MYNSVVSVCPWECAVIITASFPNIFTTLTGALCTWAVLPRLPSLQLLHCSALYLHAFPSSLLSRVWHRTPHSLWFPRFLCVIAHASMSFKSQTLFHSMGAHTWLTHLSLDRRLGCFCPLAVINVVIATCMWTYVLLYTYPRVELAWSHGDLLI